MVCVLEVSDSTLLVTQRNPSHNPTSATNTTRKLLVQLLVDVQPVVYRGHLDHQLVLVLRLTSPSTPHAQPVQHGRLQVAAQ